MQIACSSTLTRHSSPELTCAAVLAAAVAPEAVPFAVDAFAAAESAAVPFAADAFAADVF